MSASWSAWWRSSTSSPRRSETSITWVSSTLPASSSIRRVKCTCAQRDVPSATSIRISPPTAVPGAASARETSSPARSRSAGWTRSTAARRPRSSWLSPVIAASAGFTRPKRPSRKPIACPIGDASNASASRASRIARRRRVRIAFCAITAIVVSNRPRPKASGPIRTARFLRCPDRDVDRLAAEHQPRVLRVTRQLAPLADEGPAGGHPQRDAARQRTPDRVEDDAVAERARHEAPFAAAGANRGEDDRPPLAVAGQRDRAGGRERAGALRPLDRLAPSRLVEHVDAVEVAPGPREPRVRDDDVAIPVPGGPHRAVGRELADRAAELAFEGRALRLGQVAQVDQRAGLREPQHRLHERLELIRLDVVAGREQPAERAHLALEHVDLRAQRARRREARGVVADAVAARVDPQPADQQPERAQDSDDDADPEPTAIRDTPLRGQGPKLPTAHGLRHW